MNTPVHAESLSLVEVQKHLYFESGKTVALVSPLYVKHWHPKSDSMVRTHTSFYKLKAVVNFNERIWIWSLKTNGKVHDGKLGGEISIRKRVKTCEVRKRKDIHLSSCRPWRLQYGSHSLSIL